MKRESEEDDIAAAIIQMPFEPYVPHTYASREDLSRSRLGDVIYHSHGAEDECESKGRKTRGSAEANTTTLPTRIKQPVKKEDTAKDISEDSSLLLALREKHDGKSPAKLKSPSIKDRRISSTAVTPEQLKLFQAENPVLKKMRRFVSERRAQAQEKDSLCLTSTLSPSGSRAGATHLAKTAVASSSHRPPLHALEEYQMQLRLLEQHNRQRLRRARQEKAHGEKFVAKQNAHTAFKMDPVSSVIAGMKQGVVAGHVAPRQAEEPADAKCDPNSEYEIVAGPDPVEELSSSDSETGADAVVVDPPTPDDASRSHSESADNNSDSEWDLV